MERSDGLHLESRTYFGAPGGLLTGSKLASDEGAYWIGHPQHLDECQYRPKGALHGPEGVADCVSDRRHQPRSKLVPLNEFWPRRWQVRPRKALSQNTSSQEEE